MREFYEERFPQNPRGVSAGELGCDGGNGPKRLPPATKVLEEIAAAGYEGTELSRAFLRGFGI